MMTPKEVAARTLRHKPNGSIDWNETVKSLATLIAALATVWATVQIAHMRNVVTDVRTDVNSAWTAQKELIDNQNALILRLTEEKAALTGKVDVTGQLELQRQTTEKAQAKNRAADSVRRPP